MSSLTLCSVLPLLGFSGWNHNKLEHRRMLMKQLYTEILPKLQAAALGNKSLVIFYVYIYVYTLQLSATEESWWRHVWMWNNFKGIWMSLLNVSISISLITCSLYQPNEVIMCQCFVLFCFINLFKLLKNNESSFSKTHSSIWQNIWNMRTLNTAEHL